MLSIRFPGFEVTGAPYKNGAPEGFHVKPGGLKGFDDMPSGRREGIARPAAHGEFDLPLFRGPRVASVEGLAIASSAFELGNLRSLITGCGADGVPIDVHMQHQDQNLRVRARVVEATFTDRGSRGRRLMADFSIHLVCTDPRKYGEQQSFSGSSVLVHHYGNFPASPVIEVAGPRAAYTVSGPGGRSFQVLTALPSGQTDRIDLRTGRLTRNGSVAVGVVGRADVWAIPPGRRASMSISSGSMTVLLSDTYM